MQWELGKAFDAQLSVELRHGERPFACRPGDMCTDSVCRTLHLVRSRRF